LNTAVPSQDRKSSGSTEAEETRKIASRDAVSPGQCACTQSSPPLAGIQNASFELLCHPLYLPDLALSDSYLFPKLKEFMKGCKFADDKDVICTAMAGWKTKNHNSFTTDCEFWRSAGPSALQLQETMLKSDKI